MPIYFGYDTDKAKLDPDYDRKYQQEEFRKWNKMLREKSERILARLNATCKFCGSPDIVKNGIRKNSQYYICRDCGRGFVANDALPKMKYPMDTVAKAVYDYYTGSSLSDICGGIEQQTDIRPSDASVFAWVQKLTKIAKDETKKHTPEVGDTWVCDETVLKVGGRNLWLYDIIDEKTRFLINTRLAVSRTTKDVKLFMEATSKKVGGKIPKTIVTDKNYAYLDGIEQAFGADTDHIQTKPFTHEVNTELIERFHSTLKERYKVMRGLKTFDSAIDYIDGWLIWYNYFRDHETLGQTPAEEAKIKFPYRHWLDVARSQSPLAEQTSDGVVIREVDLPLDDDTPKVYRKRTKPPKANRRANSSTTFVRRLRE